MSAEYLHVVTDLRARARRLNEAADLVEGVMSGHHTNTTTGRRGRKPKRGKRAQLAGTPALVLEAIQGGHDKIPAIAKDARVKESTARTAVLALEKAGKVTREGRGRATRYIAA